MHETLVSNVLYLFMYIFFHSFWARVTLLNVADEVGTFEYVTIAQKPSHRLLYVFTRSGVGFRLSTFFLSPNALVMRYFYGSIVNVASRLHQAQNILRAINNLPYTVITCGFWGRTQAKIRLDWINRNLNIMNEQWTWNHTWITTRGTEKKKYMAIQAVCNA